jgi:hypothetical protein
MEGGEAGGARGNALRLPQQLHHWHWRRDAGGQKNQLRGLDGAANSADTHHINGCCSAWHAQRAPPPPPPIALARGRGRSGRVQEPFFCDFCLCQPRVVADGGAVVAWRIKCTFMRLRARGKAKEERACKLKGGGGCSPRPGRRTQMRRAPQPKSSCEIATVSSVGVQRCRVQLRRLQTRALKRMKAKSNSIQLTEC